MPEAKDPYYFRDEVSNSDLSWLQKYWLPEDIRYDVEQAYRFGTLIDCMITESFKIDFFRYTCAGNQYTRSEFELAEIMKRNFYRDPLCKAMAENAEFQAITTRNNFPINYNGWKFTVNARCKWDLKCHKKLGFGGDIKSTTATTQKQFVAACEHFGYWRQRAWYMDLENADKDLLIGISKINQQVFRVPIVRGDEHYNTGKLQYQELAWKWFTLFEDISKLAA